MPLIELAPRGKDVSLSLTLPEETANDVKLYARFLKATHQSATSDIISECVRRMLKQDADFQTWKVDPENTKSNRGGPRPRKAGSSTPPQNK
jgi:chlorite dismutase